MRSHETNVQRPTVLLDHYLKKLKLPTFLREYKTTAALCAKEDEDYVAFLARLCERELLEREQRAAERRIKDARFPVLKTLDLFDFAAQPSINRALVLELMRGEYLDQHENILFLGNPGTGKTHLATALGHAACAQGKRVRFFSVIELVNQLLEAREDRQLQRLRRRLDDYHLLVFDEFGYVPFSKAGAELLFDVVSRAYERQSLILTSNLPFEQWTEILGNERLTGALLDRLTHRVHILEANGESYRLNDAKKRVKKQNRENPEKPASP
jgi:DNA replication protein DnaC